MTLSSVAPKAPVAPKAIGSKLMSALRGMVHTRLGWMALALFSLLVAAPAFASEADLKMPSLKIDIMFGMTGYTLLLIGLGVCALGIVFGLVMYMRLKNLPVHKSMLEIS